MCWAIVWKHRLVGEVEHAAYQPRGLEHNRAKRRTLFAGNDDADAAQSQIERVHYADLPDEIGLNGT